MSVIPHKGHGRVVCRHGALLASCRCIGATKVRSVVDYCPTHCPFRFPPLGPRIVPPTPGMELWLVSSGGSTPIACTAEADGSIVGKAGPGHYGSGYDRLVAYVDGREITVCHVSFASTVVTPDDDVTIHAFSVAPTTRRTFPPPTGPLVVPMNLGLDGPAWRRP